MKDYYKILEVNFSASTQEIKKAYRKLAQLYHPDKNQEDPYAAARFTEIKEAYEVLTDPRKKEYYLEERWFQHSRGNKKAENVVTPESILKNVLDFDRHVSKLDVHRMNKEGLFQFMTEELIPDEIIEKLNSFKEKDINETITTILLKNLAVVPYPRLNELQIRIDKIENNTAVKTQAAQAFNKINNRHRQEKYQPFILLIIVLIISLLIFLVSR